MRERLAQSAGRAKCEKHAMLDSLNTLVNEAWVKLDLKRGMLSEKSGSSGLGDRAQQACDDFAANEKSANNSTTEPP